MGDVINLVERRSKKDTTGCVPDMDFSTNIECNKKNQERLRRERLMANRSVLRSYRIKNG